MRRCVRILPGLALGLMAGPALAHTGQGDASGLAHGFLHPLTGLDHMLAMVAVGLVAAQVGGRAMVLVPLSFIGMMMVGGALGAAGVALPHVETAIALSVAVLGAAVALRLTMPVAAAMALVGVFAVFHGHAHGAEMPEAASGLAYGAGFVAATALLHAAGLGLGLGMGRLGEGNGRPALRVAGAAFAAAGLGLLAGAF
ncbi:MULTISPECIES: HupE/UreJ family protein [unclassified Methylobacterium]|uniref:HupE/UreJ family protein n=1 Tax=unclassified Methylobacterium TaxID=2615210 RepID=UPI0006F2E1F5|nr:MULTISPECIES: HupE/UreJ family protein [unclassified Methylobacterium]KQO43106.1 urease accessory protein [Methylobacterium sp. Leaf85]TXN33203.1 HupE/UreJ family protein [Methylobacterium sp. WL19]